jgi:UDP-N-acetylglucosamine diphosphorylase/glucosamine-1-phosphate N-acetyltransferase
MIVFEDAGFARLGPLAQTRPVFELRCGAVSLFERHRRCLEVDESAVFVRPELAGLCRFTWPGQAVNESVELSGAAPLVLVNGRWLAPAELPPGLDEPHAGLVGDQLAYLVVPDRSGELTAQNLQRRLAAWREAVPQRPAGGVMIDHPWDLVQNNACALLQDERHWQTNRPAVLRAGTTVQGPVERYLADPTAQVEALVLIDTTKGPVMLDRGVVVQAFSRLEGPLYVGPDTHVLAGRLKGSALGPQCRIGGEVEASIVHGHSNKAHEGFLGHSYLGEWVNFGAGTQTSDLRNDYAKVRVSLDGEEIDTDLLKVGAVVGDYTRTAINTLLNCGTVVGACCHLLSGSGLLHGEVPSFCTSLNGHLRERVAFRRIFGGLERAMARRGCRWTPEYAEYLLALFERTALRRRQLLRDGVSTPALLTTADGDEKVVATLPS